jgi:uracil-DNA glycosylase
MGPYYKGMKRSVSPLDRVSSEAKACRLCEAKLPHEPRPVFLVGRTARLMIVGQAPGRRVHETGLPWNDPSGDVLRAWLELDREAFYDTSLIAIVPAGLCYPGTVDGADLPPLARCAPLWQPKFRAALPGIRLTLLIGSYAQAHYLGARRGKTLTDTVQAYEAYLPDFFPLPHPSWRNKRWLAANPWFARTVLPALRRAIRPCIERL